MYISWVHLLLLFSCSVISDSLRPHGLQHTRLPCPSPSPGACSNSCPLSWWCHPTILSSVVPFYSCLQSFPASGSFLKSLLQCHSSKTSILQCSAFFIVQLSHPYMSTGKIIALTRQTLVGKPEVFWNLKLSCMSFLLSLSFAVPVFQHAGPLATSPVLSFLHLHLPPWEFSPSWAPAVFGLLLEGAVLSLFQTG